ncbi:MAG: polysaccharide deacetylase family protein [Bacteroidota bacterium]|nr:polysaccharide deacetylase family protein [Bacteroidota bacterium]
MKASIAIKSIFASFFYRIEGLSWKLRRLSRSNYVILAYHRILPHAEAMAGVQAGMYVMPETFNNHLIFLKKYFNVITLKKLVVSRENAAIRPPVKPVCALTFDDGWKDFYDFAWPLLQKYQVPATVFLPTGFIGINKKFWTDQFAYMLRHRRVVVDTVAVDPDISDVIQEIKDLQGPFEDQLEAGIAILKKYPLQIVEKIIKGLAKIWSMEFHEADRDFLNWDEIHEMLDSGLISFGSHTVGHQILTTLDKPDIERELVVSKEKLLDEGVVDPSFIPFCYPNGNYTQEIAEMVRSAGYHLAVTTKKGWNQFDADRFTLRRIGIHQDMTSTVPLFACRISGFI